MFSNMMGLSPEDVLSDEEIRKPLTDAFNKFDGDRDGKLNQWDFKQAWVFLGLKGSESELEEAFNEVDEDHSGFVDLSEFMKTIRSNRLTELNLARVLDKMGVEY